MTDPSSEESIFCAAVELDDPAARSAYLASACGESSELRLRVERMLRAYEHGSFLESPAAELAGAVALLSSDIEQPGAIIGPYKLLEQIGEGGMGLVFMAEQTRPLRRRVALKIIKPGLDTRAVIARFDAERQALALMDHPNIARVYDAGATAGGRPYFVMELVRGASITDYCRQRELSLRERLALFIDVCQAVQHAHQKGIIHRDLKPTNILVSQSDAAPVPKVIDFGVAKATTQPLTDLTLFTAFSQFIGTPLYMSPEQADLGNQDVDTRSDVYALGIVLYELLTGTTPFDAQRLRSVSHDEMRRIIREEQPPRPSTRATTTAAASASAVAAPSAVNPTIDVSALKGDLDWIVMKCLDKQRTRRYQSAALLADDIAAFLRGDPVLARPPTRTYLLRKSIGKHRVALTSLAAVVLALVIGLAASLWQARTAVRAMRLADGYLRSEQRARAEASVRASRLRRELYAGDMAAAWQAWNDGEADRARTILAKYAPAAGGEDLREFSWHYLNVHCSYEPAVLGRHEAPILAAAASPDGTMLASADRAGNVVVWDLAGRRQLAAWNYSQQEVTTVAFAPDGRTLATAGQDRTVRLWRVEDWTELAAFRGHQNTVCSVSWSPDGGRLVSGSRDRSIRIWDVAARQELKVLPDNEDVVRYVLWLPDGARIVAAVGNLVRQWRTADWSPGGELASYGNGVHCLAATRDGRYLASGGYSREVLVNDLSTGQVVTHASALSTVWSLSFSADGRFLLGGLHEGGPSLWQVRAAARHLEPVRMGIERHGIQRAALLDPSGAVLVTATEEDQQIRLWDPAEILGPSILAFPEECWLVDADRGRAIGPAGDAVVIRRFPEGDEIGRLVGHREVVFEAALSSSGRLLATFARGDEVAVWDVESATLLRRLTLARPTDGSETRLKFSPDERMLAAFGNAGSVRLWSMPEGEVLRDLHVDVNEGTRIAFAPDGSRYATIVSEIGGHFWSTDSAEPRGSFGRNLRVHDLCYSPEGDRLFGAADVHGAIAWDAASGREIYRLAGHRGSVDRVALSPDGQTLVTIARDGTVRLWHVPTGRPLFTLMNHPVQLAWVRFASPRQLLIGARAEAGGSIGVFVFSAGDAAAP